MMTDDELTVMAAHSLIELDSASPMVQARRVVALIAPIIRADERARTTPLRGRDRGTTDDHPR